jgi:hypothetical protein
MKAIVLSIVAAAIFSVNCFAGNNNGPHIEKRRAHQANLGLCYMAPNCQGIPFERPLTFEQCENQGNTYTIENIHNWAEDWAFRASWTPLNEVGISCKVSEIDINKYDSREIEKYYQRNRQLQESNPGACGPSCTLEYYNGGEPTCVCAPTGCAIVDSSCHTNWYAK